MKWNPKKQCVTNDDGTLIKSNWHTNRDGSVSCSVADRYPLDCDHISRNHGKSCDKMPFGANNTPGGIHQDGLCEQATKRLERWHNYLRKELDQ
jgi:hypothetical protein